MRFQDCELQEANVCMKGVSVRWGLAIWDVSSEVYGCVVCREHWRWCVRAYMHIFVLGQVLLSISWTDHYFSLSTAP